MTRGDQRGAGAVLACLLIACAAPALLLAAALLTRTGLVPPELGYDLLARRIAPGVALIGAAAAIIAVVLAVRARKGGVLAAAAVGVSLAVIGGFAWHGTRPASPASEDVSTDLSEIPGFGVLAAQREVGPGRVSGVESCPGALPAMTQSLPESVVYELQRVGFSVRRAGVTGVYGSRREFWFGFTEDVVVRIRPGRTDIRVAARDGRDHGGRACRAVMQISQALKVGER